MPCYRPRRTLMRRGELLWNRPAIAWTKDEIIVNIRCGKCLGCDTATQRDWALRCFHEALQHNKDWRDSETGVTTKLPNSCVITLTYNQEHLPADGALNHDDFQRFMKRLRVKRVRDWRQVGTPPRVRFFMCGEYGLLGRPHFHAILYGINFEDRYQEQSRDGQVVTMSYELNELWSQPEAPGAASSLIGRASLDEFTFAGASYVAGYVSKKSQVPHRGPWVDQVDTYTGECRTAPLKPEYRKMSTHPETKGEPGGLGGDWLISNLLRTYRQDSCQLSEWTFRPPRYYDTLLALNRPDLVDGIKLKRLERMGDAAKEWTPERCSAAEAIEISRLQSRSESLE